MPWTNRGATHYHVQLGPPDKGRALKGLLGSVARIYVLFEGSFDKCKVHGLVPCCGQYGYQAQVPQHPIDSFR